MRYMPLYFKALLPACLFVIGLKLPARAASATYTIAGVGSGTIGATSFNNAAFNFTLNGDTAEITSLQGLTASSAKIANFTVSGVGSGQTSINDVVFIYANSATDFLIGVADPGINVGFEGVLTSSTTPSLDKTQGPVSLDFLDSINLPTSLGDFVLTSTTNLTFSANVAAVPEPSAALQLPLAISLTTGLLFRFRRRSQK